MDSFEFSSECKKKKKKSRRFYQAHTSACLHEKINHRWIANKGNFQLKLIIHGQTKIWNLMNKVTSRYKIAWNCHTIKNHLETTTVSFQSLGEKWFYFVEEYIYTTKTIKINNKSTSDIIKIWILLIWQKGKKTKKKPTTQGYSVINLHFKTALFAKPAYWMLIPVATFLVITSLLKKIVTI